MPVQIGFAKTGELDKSRRFNGEILPEQQAEISALASGNVAAMLKQFGDAVRAGETVARIEDSPFRAELRRTEAALRLSQANMKAAELTYRRAKMLSEKDFASRQELDNAEAQFLAATARVQADSAAAETARIALSFCTVTAPFSGVITRRYVDAGASVSLQNPLLYAIADISSLRIRVEIPERDIHLLANSPTATLSADAVPGEVFSATLLRSNAALDRSSRTLTAEFRIADPKRRLKPGMYANLTMLPASHSRRLLLQKSAVMTDVGGAYVMIAHKRHDGKHIAQKSRVTTGESDDQRIEITGGISTSDSVIVAGQQNVRDNGEISPAKKTNPAKL